MDVRKLLFENPLIVKHVRSRLRRQHLVPLVAAVAIFSICVLWGSAVTDNVKDGVAFGWMVALQGAILFLMGASQVAAAVAQAKVSGILDFHRITPQRPLATALGFVLGAPIREYVLFACTLPFSLLSATQDHPSLAGWLAVTLVMVVASLLYNTVAALAALVSPKPLGAGGGIVALVLVLNMAGMSSGIGELTPVPSFLEAIGASRYMGAPSGPALFYGIAMPQFLVALIHQIPLLAFLFLAVVRKMRNDRAMLYSKPAAVTFLATIGFLLLGDAWQMRPFAGGFPQGFALVAGVYVMTTAALLLTLAVTPGAGAFANGVRRAQQLGRSRAPAWSDLAPNWLPLVTFALILAGFGALLGSRPTETGDYDLRFYALIPMLVSAAVVFYFGSAKQYFDLRFRRNSGPYFLFFIFLIWVVPLLAGLLASLSNLSEGAQGAILAISPAAGIGLAGAGESGRYFAGGVAALASSVLLAIVFTSLRLRAEATATQAALRARA